MDTTDETTQATRRRWRLVKQNGADSYLLILMASFGATVIIVRLLLELSGYPQIGDNTYHLAHLLWGGLLLFLGLLLLLLFSNRWLIWVAAMMGGAGVGLFIDEVGKFITQSNDYFFPLAFPIIYAFMLVCVWIYVRVRRHRPSDTRTLLYHALDDLKQVLDNDLDPFEHSELLETLDRVAATATDSNERQLALQLRQFVISKEMRLASSPLWIEQVGERVRFWLARNPSRKVLKGLLIIGFSLMVVQTLIKAFALASVSSSQGWKVLFGNTIIVSGKTSYVVQHPALLLAHNAFILVTGLLACATVILLLTGRDRPGLRAGTLALVLALTIVNLITFYFNQMYTVVDAIGQLFLLFVAQVYRWRFYASQAAADSSETETAVVPSP